jgi:hypothetical protein
MGLSFAARTLYQRAGPRLGMRSVGCSDEKVLFVRRCAHGDIKEAHHHLVILLFSPAPQNP